MGDDQLCGEEKRFLRRSANGCTEWGELFCRPTPYTHSLTDLVTRHQTNRLSLFWGIGGQVCFRKFARKLDLVFTRIPSDSGHEVGRGDAIAHQKPHTVFAENFHDRSNRNLLSHNCRTAGALTTHGLPFVVEDRKSVV